MSLTDLGVASSVRNILFGFLEWLVTPVSPLVSAVTLAKRYTK